MALTMNEMTTPTRHLEDIRLNIKGEASDSREILPMTDEGAQRPIYKPTQTLVNLNKPACRDNEYFPQFQEGRKSDDDLVIEFSMDDSPSPTHKASLTEVEQTVQSGRQDPYLESTITPQGVSSQPQNKEKIPTKVDQPINALLDTLSDAESQPECTDILRRFKKPEPYSKASPIPFTRYYLYPHASPKFEFQERYHAIRDLFQQIVENDRGLHQAIGHINYDFRVCGTCPQDAKEYIVVFCLRKHFPRLRKLFNSSRIKQQRHASGVGKSNIFSLASKLKTNLRTDDSAKLPLPLVFWQRDQPPTVQNAWKVSLVADAAHPEAQAITLVYNGSKATLALFLNVNGKIYGLTVDHLFSKSDNNQSSDNMFVDLGQHDLGEEEKIEHDEEEFSCSGLWVDEVDYDYDTAQAQTQEQEPLQTVSRNSAATEIQNGSKLEIGVGNKLNIVGDHKSLPNYDWALVEMKFDFQLASEILKASPFRGVLASSMHKTDFPAVLISGIAGMREGYMRQRLSYLGGALSQNPCRAWNFTFIDGKGRTTADYLPSFY
jgi:hypothetical protein